MAINGNMFTWREICSGITQVLSTFQIWFDEGIERMCIKFADDTKLGSGDGKGQIAKPQKRLKIHKSLDRFRHQALSNKMLSNGKKCRVLILSSKHQIHK